MPSMLTDKEMEQAAGQLASFRKQHDDNQTTLSEMLEKYSTLIEDYNRLKSDYEEERHSRERYKQMARGSDRNPFVLVLIDGDGYVFDDDLISSGAEGGERAAHLLNQAIKDSLHHRALENCRIMVRIYANLSGLSKTLSRVKLAGPEKRSLTPFVANFNRSNELFDFVDAGELKENADYKIRALFRLFVDSPTCKHIFFAGCHDVGYISELTPHVGTRDSRDRITLVRSSAFHHEFSRLGMRVETFPTIFRQTPLDAYTQPQTKTLPTRSAEPTAAGANDTQATNICRFYQSGKCTYGKACRNLHISKSASNGTHHGHASASTLSDVKDWRQRGSDTQPFQLSDLAKNDNDFFMNGSRATPNIPNYSADDFAAALPEPEEIPLGDIAVNIKQHRPDPYNAPVSQEDWTAFNARAARHKLCNNYHLTGGCQNSSDCQYDHSPISRGVMKCLQQVARQLPCGRRGGCRLHPCIQGHICQKLDCKQRGGKAFCKIPFAAHEQDLNVAQFVPGVAHQVYENDINTITSGKGSSPSSPEVESVMAEDSDEEKQDGAPLSVGDTDSLD